jgi:hypothetical protein
MLHARHAPHEALPQQRPSTQFPLAQVEPVLHVLPLGLFWQVPLIQEFPPLVLSMA